MKYYVIWPDGQKFGPADIPTLNQWIQENRVTAHTELESADTGARLSAASVPGLMFPAASPDPMAANPTPNPVETTYASPYGGASAPGTDPMQNNPYQYPPQPSGYVRPAGTQDGQTEAIISFVCSGLGLCCCCLLPIAGIILGNIAKNKGNPLGNTAMIVGWVVLVLSIAGNLIWFFVQGGLSAFNM